MSAKIRRVGRHYLTLQACTTKDEALLLLKRMAKAVVIIYDNELLTSYRLRVLDNQDSIDHEGLELEEVLLFSDGHLPIIFCSISFDIAKREASQTALDTFENEFEMKLFKSFSIGY